ncbi:hypothetical protein KCU87_g391, partial [Aureobasidium melanogenum]
MHGPAGDKKAPARLVRLRHRCTTQFCTCNVPSVVSLERPTAIVPYSHASPFLIHYALRRPTHICYSHLQVAPSTLFAIQHISAEPNIGSLAGFPIHCPKRPHNRCLKRATTDFEFELVKSPHNLFVLTIDPGLVCDVVLSTDLFLVKDEHLRVHHTVRTTVKKNRRSLLSRKRHRRCCRELEILDWSNNHSLKLDSICGAQFYDTGGRSALLDCLNPEVPAREVDQNTLSILNAHLIRCQHHELTTERVGVTDIAFQNSNRRRGDLVKSFFATESCIHSCSEFRMLDYWQLQSVQMVNNVLRARKFGHSSSPEAVFGLPCPNYSLRLHGEGILLARLGESISNHKIPSAARSGLGMIGGWICAPLDTLVLSAPPRQTNKKESTIRTSRPLTTDTPSLQGYAGSYMIDTSKDIVALTVGESRQMLRGRFGVCSFTDRWLSYAVIDWALPACQYAA